MTIFVRDVYCLPAPNDCLVGANYGLVGSNDCLAGANNGRLSVGWDFLTCWQLFVRVFCSEIMS